MSPVELHRKMLQLMQKTENCKNFFLENFLKFHVAWANEFSQQRSSTSSTSSSSSMWAAEFSKPKKKAPKKTVFFQFLFF